MMNILRLFFKWSWFPFLSLLLFFSSHQALAQNSICDDSALTISPSECQALVTLYENTAGVGRTHQDNWFISPDVDTWRGVTVEGGQVRYLDLSHNNLQGILPREIGDLSNVISLSLQNNLIVDIADDLGVGTAPLAHLSYLNLSYNLLQELPPSLGNIHTLEDIYLGHNQLESLPSEWGNLNNMISFSAPHNQLDSIPDSFTQRSNLYLFDISFNQFVQLPIAVASWSGLHIFDGDHNLLQNIDTLVGLGSLRYIYLHNNMITSLPNDLSGLSSLRYLSLHHNELTSLPESLGSLSALRYLRLSNNQLTSVPDSLGALSNLSTLFLNDNQLTELPASLGTLAELDFLYIYNNQILGTFPDSWGDLTDIDRLDITFNKLDRERDDPDSSQSYLAKVPPSLQSWYDAITVKYTYGQDDITAPIFTQETAHDLILSSPFHLSFTLQENSFAVDHAGSGLALTLGGGGNCGNISMDTETLTSSSGVFDITFSASTGVYKGCTLVVHDHAGLASETITLEDFVWSEDRRDFCWLPAFDDIDTISENECRALIEIYLGTNGDDRTNHNHWFETTDVEQWFGVRTGIYDGARHVDGLFLHRSLGLDIHGSVEDREGNNLGGSLPDVFSDLPYLRDINLSRNTLGGSLPPSMTSLSLLTHFFALDNHLNGALRSDIGILDALQVLHLKGNNLSGVIPPSIGDMAALQQLMLQENEVSGPLASEIANISSLQVLRLDHNEITGEIPASWGNLSSLQDVGLGYNDLMGTIPSSFTGLTQLSRLDLAANNLDRMYTHDALVPYALQAWIYSIGQVYLANQGDIEVPTMTLSGTIPWEISGARDLTMTVMENSYALDEIATPMRGMDVVFGGSATCQSLYVESSYDGTSYSGMVWNTGTQIFSLIPTASGAYIDCAMQLKDWGGNLSSPVFLDSFVYHVGKKTVCYDPSLLIDQVECFALSDLYDAFHGTERWSETDVDTSDDWFSTPDVGQWFGLDIDNGQVITIDLHDNYLVGVPSDSFSFPGLKILDLSSNQLSGSWGWDLGEIPLLEHMTLSTNELTGSLPDISGMTGLQTFRVRDNHFSGYLPSWGSGLDVLTTLDLGENTFNGPLSASLREISSLQHLFLDDNQLVGPLGTGILNLSVLETFHIQHNQLDGVFPDLLPSRLLSLSLAYNQFDDTLPASWTGARHLQELHIEDNHIRGSFPETFAIFTGMDEFFIDHNYLDREQNPMHYAYIPAALSGWWTGIATTMRSDQVDDEAPVLSTSSTIPSIITHPFIYTVHAEENSYVLDNMGDGLEVHIGGPSSCDTIFLAGDTLMTSKSQDLSLTLSPLQGGAYVGCTIEITDHGGNVGSLLLPGFYFDASCGNELIDIGEDCDEGRFCNDLSSCVDDIAVCALECSPRLIDNCNPSCEASRCGDAYIDPDGIDNTAGTYDDESCDEGSFCNDGTECTHDSSVCAGGDFECKARAFNSCTPFCTAGTCGDNYLDMDGPDDILGTADDEECDDGNIYNGDGCSMSCTIEHCGDGYPDSNGPDNIINTSDDEECDLGLANGILGGLCSSTCSLPNDECVYCYEICDGGTGSHSIFLLMDVSGSMNANKRLQNAKTGAKNFVNLVEQASQTNTGFVTKIGLIKFNGSSVKVLNPTNNYHKVRNKINKLEAGGGTNFGDPIRDAIDFFATHDTSRGQHIILLSDGEPTVSSNSAFTPGERALYQANDAKNRGINLYTIAVDQTDEGLEYMSHISSSTKLNYAREKPVEQSSAIVGSYQCVYWTWWGCRRRQWVGGYPVEKSVDAIKAGNQFSLTQEDYHPWWQVDLGQETHIDMINIWNRTSYTSETADYWIHISDIPFNSDDLDTLLVDTSIDSFFFTGPAMRPSQHTFDTTGRYVRLQLTATNQAPEPSNINLGLSEVEIIGCPETDVINGTCSDVYHYQDYDGLAIEVLYGHIFGSIHCGCMPEKVCGICGDGIVEPVKGEICDEGSFCDDLSTSCTADPDLCVNSGLGECRPRFVNGCTDTCVQYFCGDGFLFTGGRDAIVGTDDDEECDDGNSENGDGCSETCKRETCGDGIVDEDGSDNIWETLQDNELCDDGNSENGDGCSEICKIETCGDGIMDEDGPDDILNTRDDEWCDTGRYCDDAGTISCVDDPSICAVQGLGDSHCSTRYLGNCSPDCDRGLCGDAHIQSGTLVISGTTYTRDEACDPGLYCEDALTFCGDVPEICTLLNIGDGSCAPRALGNCTPSCELNICGDGFLSDTEECDDGNEIDDDACSNTCISRYCGDDIVDENGNDNTLFTSDDESCDDGIYNGATRSDCTDDCKLVTCGNGILNDGEACDYGGANGRDGKCTKRCRMTTCGDALRQRPNGEGVGGLLNDGYELCDGDTLCETDCTYPEGTLYCGDGIIQSPNDLGATELCDDGGENGQAGKCNIDCSSLITCGDGITVIPNESCDDGNMDDGDGCSHLCQLESPFHVPATFSGRCAATTLPSLNTGELLPVRWQLIPVSAVDADAHDCGDLSGGKWIIGKDTVCSFDVMRGNRFGTEMVATVTGDCMNENYDTISVLQDAFDDYNIAASMPLGSLLVGSGEISSFVDGIYGQYSLQLDKIEIPYCILNASGSMISHTANYEEDVCSLPFSVAYPYFVQKGPPLQEMQNATLDNFWGLSGSAFVDEKTPVSEDISVQGLTDYQGEGVPHMITNLVQKYSTLAIEKYEGLWGVLWKVPNQHIYFYKGTEPFTMNNTIFDMGFKDIDGPFTLIVEDADLMIEGSLESTHALYLVNGSIKFVPQNCDTIDRVEGIYITIDGFDTEETLNTHADASQRCNKGKLIVKGILIGTGLDQVIAKRRAVLDSRSDNWGLLYGGSENIAFQARKLFEICYLPALLNGMTTPLSNAGTICNHANRQLFEDQANDMLAPYISQYYDYSFGASCVSPHICSTFIPNFTCLYDNSDCVESFSLACDHVDYLCRLEGKDLGGSGGVYDISTCEPFDTVGCMVEPGECLINEVTGTIECLERCIQGVYTATCPAPKSPGWKEVIRWIINNGLPWAGEEFANFPELRRAFLGLHLSQIQDYLSSYRMTLSDEDIVRFTSLVNDEDLALQDTQRNDVIYDGSSVLIEANVDIWDNIPPGGNELLETIQQIKS